MDINEGVSKVRDTLFFHFNSLIVNNLVNKYLHKHLIICKI
jgi:hypothetical protein